MIVVNCEQGTPEWHAARLGIPTASEFARILPSTGKPSTQATTYMHKLLAEWMRGIPTDNDVNEWMERGKALEQEARDYYEFHTDLTVKQVGFVKDDSETCGCSPDGFVGDGGIEIKCPSPGVHVEYLLNQALPTKYIPQVQGNMFVTGRHWWDFVSYHPDMTPLIIRVDRDEKYIGKLVTALTEFTALRLKKQQELIQLGYKEAA